MAVDHWNAIALRADFEFGEVNRVLRQAAENFSRLSLHLLFFAGNKRNHVFHRVERRDARIAGAGERLHGDYEDFGYAEGVLEWLERHRQTDRRAVWIGHQIPVGVAAPLLLRR